MSNFRKYSLLALVVIVLVGTFATLATDVGWWTLSTLLDNGSRLVILLVLLLCTQYLSRKMRTEARRTHSDITQLGEHLFSSISNLESSSAELHRLVRLHSDELARVKNRLGTLETKVDAGRSLVEMNESNFTYLLHEVDMKMVHRDHLNDFRKELRGIIRDSERRVMSTAPKAVEVRRARERIESAERRILGAFETEMYAQNSNLLERSNLVERLGERVEELGRAIEAEYRNDKRELNKSQIDISQKSSGNLVSAIKRHVTSTVRDSTRQTEALLHLSSRFEDKKLPMPSTGGFAIDAQALGHLIALIEERRPKRILELGSGTSTVWLGYLCRTYGAELITLDHLDVYLKQTQEALRVHHLDKVETRLAPLQEVECHGATYNWYSWDALEGLEDIDLLIIDGPPESTGPMARYPALPSLHSVLSAKATVVLDDTHRESEANIMKKWAELYPEFVRLENGISRLGILQRTE